MSCQEPGKREYLFFFTVGKNKSSGFCVFHKKLLRTVLKMISHFFNQIIKNKKGYDMIK